METDNMIKSRIELVLSHLNERQRRGYLWSEASILGWGGISKISKLSGVSRSTISNGVWVVEEAVDLKCVRKKGGGRKKIIDKNPDILLKIKDLVEPHVMGDPMNPLIWTSKSVRKITSELGLLNYKVCHEVVRQCLKSLGFSLQSNKKTDEGAKNEDRDAQFEYINELSKEFMSAGNPVISVDCKKKELIGNFKNSGQEWQAEKEPLEVKVYDFVDKDLGKAAPYGIYDLAKNEGFVNVGISADTAEFAVNSIRSWWTKMGKEMYPSSRELYVNADGGGSNSSRGRLWKSELQKFATETGLKITVSHFPPGTSKWNKIEHRLFSHISINWRAKPLTSIEVIVNLIANTTTEKGLKVQAIKDDRLYPKGIKISNQDFSNINISTNAFRGEWNYSISP